MWQFLFGKKTAENEHSIQVRFAPGWTAAFIEQSSMQMPPKWTSDTEEWLNVSSMAWHGIIRTIEEALYCEETKAIQKKIRPEILVGQDMVRSVKMVANLASSKNALESVHVKFYCHSSRNI